MEKISKDKIQYVFARHPEAVGDNTKFLKAFWEIVCESRKIDKTWENIKAIMEEYRPETVTRMRRFYFQSTEAQLEKEQEFYVEFRPDHC